MEPEIGTLCIEGKYGDFKGGGEWRTESYWRKYYIAE